MTPLRRFAPLLAIVLLPFAGTEVSAQRINGVPWSLVEEVMPQAERFDEAAGDPPVVAAYATDPEGAETLIGYVFLTSDLPPEQYGYSGPIEALVGMRLDGTLTGVRVTEYHESYMSQMGDFLHRRGFQEQFSGKYIGDPFRVWGDVDGISRVTISVRALSRGVRDSARRVAMAYSGTGPVVMPEEPTADVVGMSWFEMRRQGVVERFEVTEPGQGSAGISLAYISSDRVGEYMYGRIQYESALRSMARRDGAEHLMLYAVDGSRLRLFLREGWSLAQDGDTTLIDPGHIVMLGLPSGGAVSGEATMVGVMLIKRQLDIRKPFTFIYDLGEFGVHNVEYTTQDARILMAEREVDAEAARLAAERAAEAASGTEPGASGVAASGIAQADSAGSAASPRPGAVAGNPASAGSVGAAGGAAAAGGADAAAGGVGVTATGEIEAPPGAAGGAAAGGAGAAVAGDPGSAAASEPGGAAGAAGGAGAGEAVGAPSADPSPQELDFTVSEDETLLERTLASTSWSRVATMLLVLSLATWAFFAKSVKVRWLSLSITLVVLGFLDGGFLSVSHITSGIWAGLGVYLRDVPLLLIALFTVVSTLIWGRVFCGFLCPFGALQDFIERVVPKRFQRPFPQAVHDRAIWLKYGILAVIIVPALAGSHASFYQYFEPFGTVFFLSTSVGFWAIAGGILVASAIVPRFYCRYACPLGAALAVTSLLSLRRIERVEQCQHCKVCEQKCPTGAIRGHEIDFKECVRCNLCEVQLIERRGVCRHEMDVIRPRLVQLQLRGAAGGD